MKVLHIGEVLDAVEAADENTQGYYLPDTGEIVFALDDESRKYIPLPDKAERNDYHTMEMFIESLDDPQAREWLENAIRGKGAFRRFRGACEKFHLLNDWYDFEYQAHLDLAAAWCEDHGIVYDMETGNDEEQGEEDVSDFYRDDFREPQVQIKKEAVRNPVHVIRIHDDNLMNALYAADGFRTDVLKEKSNLDKAEEMLRRYLNECTVIAASDQGRIAGLAVYEKTSVETILRMLYVVKDMRHRGIGKMLIKAVKDEMEGPLYAQVPDQAADFFIKNGASTRKVMVIESELQ